MEIRELSDEIQHEYGIELKFADPEASLPNPRESTLTGSGLPDNKMFHGKKK